MTGFFIDISEYLEEPIETEVARAVRILGLEEEYDEYDSQMNV